VIQIHDPPFAKCTRSLKISAPQDSVLANHHLTLLHSCGIVAKKFNGVTDKTIGNLLA
jgi:hypothetical protein